MKHRDKGQGTRDKGAGQEPVAYEVRVTGEEARQRIGAEFGEMVGRLMADGVDFMAIAVVGIVPTPEGLLIKTTGVGCDPAFDAVLKKKIRAAVDVACIDAGMDMPDWAATVAPAAGVN